MSLNLQLHLVMMSKYSKFGVDTLILFEKWARIKFFHNNNDDNNDYDDVVNRSSTTLIRAQIFLETDKLKIVYTGDELVTFIKYLPKAYK